MGRGGDHTRESIGSWGKGRGSHEGGRRVMGRRGGDHTRESIGSSATHLVTENQRKFQCDYSHTHMGDYITTTRHQSTVTDHVKSMA